MSGIVVPGPGVLSRAGEYEMPTLPGYGRRHLRGWDLARPPDEPFELNTRSTQAEGLVAWWPVSGSRGVLRDRARGLDGTITGATYMYDGQMGAGLDFSDDYVTIPSFYLPAPFTLTAWVLFDRHYNYGTIFKHGATSIQLYTDGVGSMKYWRSGGAGHDLATGLVPGLYSIAAVMRTANSLTGYINGGERSTIDPGYPAATSVGYLGAFDGASEYLDGKIFDFRWYNRALSPGEIWSIHDPATRWELYRPAVRWWGGWSPAEVEEQVEATTVNYGTVYDPRGWRRNRPPDLEIELNTDSPQARGLAAWHPIAGGRFYVDGLNRIYTGTRPPIVHLSDGSAFRGDATNYAYTSLCGGSGVQGTIVVRGIKGANAASAQPEILKVASGGSFFHLFQDGFVSSRISFRGRSGETWVAGSAEQSDWYSVIGALYTWCCTYSYDGTNYTTRMVRFGPDGQRINVSAATAVGAIGNPGTSAIYPVGASGWQFDTFEARVYDHIVPDSLLAQMHNPSTRWELYRPVLKMAWGVKEIITLEEAAELAPWLYSILRPRSDRPIHHLQL